MKEAESCCRVGSTGWVDVVVVVVGGGGLVDTVRQDEVKELAVVVVPGHKARKQVQVVDLSQC